MSKSLSTKYPYQQAYYYRHRAKVLARRHNPLARKKYRDRYHRNRDVIRIRQRAYYLRNRERIQTRVKAYALKNRNKTNARQRRKRQNPQIRARHNLHKRVADCLKGLNKSANTLTLLGCSYEHFVAHMESLFLDGMSWNNYGAWRRGQPLRWHIDHITPCDSFDLTDPAQQRECFRYTNLQPLWAIDNLKKGNKRLDILTQSVEDDVG